MEGKFIFAWELLTQDFESVGERVESFCCVKYLIPELSPGEFGRCGILHREKKGREVLSL